MEAATAWHHAKQELLQLKWRRCVLNKGKVTEVDDSWMVQQCHAVLHFLRDPRRLGSRHNPVRSVRVLVLHNNGCFLAGCIPDDCATKLFQLLGLPLAIVKAERRQAAEQTASELWLSGGKVDQLDNGTWESYEAAA